VFDAEDAMKPDAPLLHPERQQYEGGTAIPLRGDVDVRNLSTYFTVRRGNVEDGFKRADHIIENRFTTQMVQHVEMECPVCVAEVAADDTINVWVSCQSPLRILGELSQAFGLPHSRFRIHTPISGGGFGNKLTVHAEGAAVALALTTLRPVRVALTREETLTTTTVKHPFIVYIKDGVSNDGKLLAREMRVILNAGAYSGGSGVLVCRNCAFGAVVTYHIDHLRFESFRIYTNEVPSGAFRGFGCEATIWAIETQMDEVAKTLGMDPIEFRLKNLSRESEPNLMGEPMSKNGMRECITKVLEDIRNARLPPPLKGWLRGIGYAVGDKYSIGTTSACAQVKINADGTVEVRTSATEIGVGSQTVLSQIAAEELGVDLDRVKITEPDTLLTPFDEGAFSSRQTFNNGNAVRLACIDARRQILSNAAKLMREPQSELRLDLRRCIIQGRSKHIKLTDLFVPLRFGNFVGEDGEFLGRGYWHFKPGLLDPSTGLTEGERINTSYTPAVAGAVVDVDSDTGQVKVVKLSCSLDVGKALNPLAVEGQMEGGLMMGLGHTLFEECSLVEGRILNTSFLEYQVPRAMDVPSSKNLSSIIVEVPEPDGPFGARGAGEASIVVVGAALGNAIAAATGVRLKDLPFSNEKIWRSLQKR
jgi:CO/xanthine dehydrogenase Mo-binding subunit